MMDNNSQGPVENDSVFDLDDWITEFTADYQQTVGNTATKEMTTQVSSSTPSTPTQWNKTSVNLEDMYNGGLPNKEMIPVNYFPQNSTTATSSKSGLTRATPIESVVPLSALLDISPYACDFVSNAVGQGTQSYTFSNRKESPECQPLQQPSQPHQHLQLRQHLLKQKICQPHIQPSLVQPNTPYGHQKKHHHTLSDQLHPYSRAMFTTSQDHRKIGKLQNQHPLGLQSKVGHSQQQQKIAETDVFRMKAHQNPVHILQQSEVTEPPQNFQRTLNQLQLNVQQPGVTRMPNNSLLEGMQHRFQTSGTLCRNQGVMFGEEQKPREQLAEASIDFTTQNDHAALADWHNQVYRQIMSMRETCLPELNKVYKNAIQLSLQTQNAESAIKFEKSRIFVERMIRFLNISRADHIPSSKEKVMNYMNFIIKYVNSVKSKNAGFMQQHEHFQPSGSNSKASQLQQDGNMKLQFNPLLDSPRGVPNSDVNMTNFIQNFPLTGPQTNTAPSPLQHHSQRKAQHTNMISSYNNSFQIGIEQRTLSPLQKSLLKSARQNILSMPQLRNSSPKMGVNVSDSTTSSFMSSATISLFHHLNHQLINQNLQLEKMKQTMQQTLFFTSSAPSHPHVISPQSSQHSISSQQVDTNNVLSPHSNCGTPLDPASSTFVLPSPSAPSSIPVNPEKHSSGLSPLSAAENSEQHPTAPVLSCKVQYKKEVQYEMPDTNAPGGSQEAHAMEQPHSRLIKVVKSLSSKAFSASLRDIHSVVNMIDKIAETSGSEPSNPVGQALVADKQYHLQDETDFKLQYGTALRGKMRRHINVMALESLSMASRESDSFHRSIGKASEMDSTARSMNKRPRIENNHTDVLEEIKVINKQLVETLLDVVLDPAEYSVQFGAGDGTIVRCSYSTVCFHEILRPRGALSGMMPNFLLRLLVPVDYPNSSPIVLDTTPDVWSGEQSERLLEKAKARFNAALCKLSQPMSLGDMARTWDSCARAVFSEFAEQRGGKSYSSSYGSWENCITAS